MSTSPPRPRQTVADIQAMLHREARRVTSYDVAILAGVSQSAVSRCFKPGASVSKAMYARVMDAAQQLDYIPNAAARSLITRRSNLVAVIISNLVNLYYPEVLSELSRNFTQRGMRLLLFTLAHEGELERTLAEVWQYQVDGAIVASHLSAAQAQEFEKRRIPFVLYNRELRDANVNAILCDQAASARAMVSRLVESGHRRFAIIDGPADSVIAQDRKRGAAVRLAELGLPEPLVVSGAYDYASGVQGMHAIREQMDELPDAILCGNDVMAIGCLDAARLQLGLEVPRQLSISGFDGVAPSTWLSYRLTTVRQPVRSMAYAAAELLTRLIHNPYASPERRVFSTSFVEGDTARLLPMA